MYKVQNTQTRITKYKYINAQRTKRTNTEHEIQILRMHKIQTRTMQDTHKHETQNTDYSETQLRTKLDDYFWKPRKHCLQSHKHETPIAKHKIRDHP